MTFRLALVAVAVVFTMVLSSCTVTHSVAPESEISSQEVRQLPAPSAEQGVVSAPVRIEYGEHRSQFGELYLPETSTEPLPVVVLIHGGFWQEQFRLSLMDDLARDLASQGYVAWNIEYRRVGGDGGWPATGVDVAAAIDHLVAVADDHPIDLEQVVLVGHSAGGHLALWSLDRPDAAVTPVGAIGLGAIVDLAYFPESASLLGGTVTEVGERYEDARPVLDPDQVILVHGTEDPIVPSASLAVAFEAGVPVVEIGGDDHFDLIDPASNAWQTTLGQIDGLFGSK